MMKSFALNDNQQSNILIFAYIYIYKSVLDMKVGSTSGTNSTFTWEVKESYSIKKNALISILNSLYIEVLVIYLGGDYMVIQLSLVLIRFYKQNILLY